VDEKVEEKKIMVIKVLVDNWWIHTSTVGQFMDAVHGVWGWELDDTKLGDLSWDGIKTEIVWMTQEEFDALPPVEI